METLSLEKIGPPHRFRSMEFEFRKSPTSGGFYFSAPTSPVRSAIILSEFARSIRAVVPFDWEEKPGTPKKNGAKEDAEDFSEDGGDFEFSTGFVVAEERRNSVEVLSTAEELFCNGQIRPLRLPPRLQQSFDFDKPTGTFKTWGSSNVSTPRSPRSPLKEGQRIVKEALWRTSKRGKGKGKGKGGDFDPFAVALQETVEEKQRRRGLDRNSPGRRGGRLCSPLRIFECKRGEEFSSEGNKSGRRLKLKEFLLQKGRRGWSLLVALAPAKHLKKQQPYVNIANQIQLGLG